MTLKEFELLNGLLRILKMEENDYMTPEKRAQMAKDIASLAFKRWLVAEDGIISNPQDIIEELKGLSK